MITATQTVTINAAFLQEIKDDNENLYELLDELQSLCSANRPRFVEPERFSELLMNLRDQLALHFALEEALGYFDDPLDVDPGICEAADRLRSEHVSLYQEVVAIADAATDLLYPKIRGPALPSLVFRFRRFHVSLQRHESHEFALISTVFHREPGG